MVGEVGGLDDWYSFRGSIITVGINYMDAAESIIESFWIGGRIRLILVEKKITERSSGNEGLPKK